MGRMAPDTPELLNTNEVAALCEVEPDTVRIWARIGRIPVITLPGGRKRFRREDIERMLTPTEPTVQKAGAA